MAGGAGSRGRPAAAPAARLRADAGRGHRGSGGEVVAAAAPAPATPSPDTDARPLSRCAADPLRWHGHRRFGRERLFLRLARGQPRRSMAMGHPHPAGSHPRVPRRETTEAEIARISCLLGGRSRLDVPRLSGHHPLAPEARGGDAAMAGRRHFRQPVTARTPPPGLRCRCCAVEVGARTGRGAVSAGRARDLHLGRDRGAQSRDTRLWRQAPCRLRHRTRSGARYRALCRSGPCDNPPVSCCWNGRSAHAHPARHQASSR